MGGQGDIVISIVEMELEAPIQPPMPLLVLTMEDFRGKEIDPIVEQEKRKYLEDEDFVKSRAFIQFLWHNIIENFEARCKKIKAKKPSKHDSEIEEEVKASLMEDKNQIIPIWEGNY